MAYIVNTRILPGYVLKSKEQQTMKKQNQQHIPPAISEAAWTYSLIPPMKHGIPCWETGKKKHLSNLWYPKNFQILMLLNSQ